jgi:glycosyltransferase involved in cell wall biosynthesis
MCPNSMLRSVRSAADTAVLMSVYANDRPAYVTKALDSVLRQSHGGLDLFLMIDGPIDSEVGAAIDAFQDERLLVRRSPTNRGLACSLNALIDEALAGRYEFFARMDADDIAVSERIELQTTYLRENPRVDVLGTSCVEIDEDENVLFVKKLPTSDEELKRRMLERCPFIHPTVTFRRRVFETGIRYQTNSHLTEDMFLWVDLANAGFVFANLRQELLRYRIDSRFYARRSGIKKALSEYRAKRYIAHQLRVTGIRTAIVPLAAFGLRLLPAPLLKLCYRHLR